MVCGDSESKAFEYCLLQWPSPEPRPEHNDAHEYSRMHKRYENHSSVYGRVTLRPVTRRSALLYGAPLFLTTSAACIDTASRFEDLIPHATFGCILYSAITPRRTLKIRTANHFKFFQPDEKLAFLTWGLGIPSPGCTCVEIFIHAVDGDLVQDGFEVCVVAAGAERRGVRGVCGALVAEREVNAGGW